MARPDGTSEEGEFESKIDSPVGPLQEGDFRDYPDGPGWQRVQHYVTSTMSAWLVNPKEDAEQRDAQMLPDYRPERETDAEKHPCAKSLSSLMDFETFEWIQPTTTNTTNDDTAWGCCCADVRFDQRDILLAVNMHHCCFTCHKYGHECDCRFGFPHALTDGPCVIDLSTTIDKYKRIRQQVYAPRNNHFINRYAAKPQIMCCWRGNCDFSFVCDPWSVGVYCCMYVSKSEEPDTRLMCNIMAKSLSHPGMNTCRRDVLRKAITSMLSSTLVGATQAVWSLMKFEFVRKSRKVIHISTLPRPRVAEKFLNLRKLKEKIQEEGSKASAFEEAGPTSHLGRRNAYSAFVKRQQQLLGNNLDITTDVVGENETADMEYQVSFHAILTGYNITTNPNYISPATLRCENEHLLEQLTTEHDGYTCSSCAADEIIPPGSELRGCHACQYYICCECTDAISSGRTVNSDADEVEGDEAEMSNAEGDDFGFSNKKSTSSTRSKRKKKRKTGWGDLLKPVCVDWPDNPSSIDFKKSPAKFEIGKYRYKKYTCAKKTDQQQQPVINMTPHMAYDEQNEQCAYGLLLLHHVWPNGNESDLLIRSTAVQSLEAAMKTNTSLQKIANRHAAAREAEKKIRTQNPGYDADNDERNRDDQSIDDDIEDDYDSDDAGLSITETQQLTDSEALASGALTLLSKKLFASMTDHVQSIRRTSTAATNTERAGKEAPVDGIYRYANHDDLAAKLEVGISEMDSDQGTIFNTANNALIGKSEDQLLGIVSGAGGTGKLIINSANTTLLFN